MTELRIATRRSDLALAQARFVAGLLETRGVSTALVEVSTVGDIDRTTAVTALTEMGAFVRAVQQAVLDGRADLAVHSCKDLPTTGPDEIAQWFPQREAPWDALCGATLDTLPRSARVGTGSPRRASQLALLRPDLEIVPVRGNVETRLGKIGVEVDAVVLAEAGLRRLGLDGSMSQRLTLDEMVPAPAQAALCVEALIGSEVASLLDAIDEPDVRRVVEVERRLLSRTGAGCRSALGALATHGRDGFTMTGFVDDAAGPRRAEVAAPTSEAVVTAMIDRLEL